MYETENIEQEPLDVKVENDYKSAASSQYKQERDTCDDINIDEEPLRVIGENGEEYEDFTVALCDICRQYCVGIEELVTHLYTHTSDVHFTCIICHRSYTSKFYLKRHFETLHTVFKCKQDSSQYKRTLWPPHPELGPMAWIFRRPPTDH